MVQSGKAAPKHSGSAASAAITSRENRWLKRFGSLAGGRARGRRDCGRRGIADGRSGAGVWPARRGAAGQRFRRAPHGAARAAAERRRANFANFGPAVCGSGGYTVAARNRGPGADQAGDGGKPVAGAPRWLSCLWACRTRATWERSCARRKLLERPAPQHAPPMRWELRIRLGRRRCEHPLDRRCACPFCTDCRRPACCRSCELRE